MFCHTLCTIYNCRSRSVYFSFPGLAFASVGLPCTGPGCPSFGLTVLGSFSRLQGGCRVDRLGFLLAFLTGHPPFCCSLRPFFRPCGHSREGSTALFRQNFLCSISRRSFSHHLTPQTRPFSICRPCFSTFRPCFSTFRPCFSVSFSRPVRFCLPRKCAGFFLACFFLFPTYSGFFGRSFCDLSRPSLRLPCGTSGSSARSFAPAACPRGFASPCPFLFPPLTSSEVSPGAASSSQVTFGFVSTG